MAKDVLKGKMYLKPPGHFIDEAAAEVEEIKRRHSIKALFESYGVALSKTSNNGAYMGLCPFHDDHNPSLSVDETKGLYHCFGCGAKGDIIELVRKMEDLSFRDAIRKLAGGGMELTVPKGKPEPVKEEPVVLPAISLDIVGDYCNKKIYENRDAFEYLTGARKIDAQLIERFKIGYSDGSLLKIISDKQKESLKALGIITKKGREHFYGCITFPVLDDTGKVVGMYGRRITDAEPKHLYLAGPHRGIPNRKAGKVYDEIIIVESIIDCLSLITMGIENVQALYGAGVLTAEHLETLKADRVKTIVLGFDNDEAGRAGAEKHKKTLLDEGFGVKTIVPPAGKDWNDCLKAGSGKQEILKLINEAPIMAAPIMAAPVIAAPEQLPEEKAELAVKREGGKYIFTIPDIIYRVLGVKTVYVVNLRANIKAEYGGRKFIDNVDLFSARSRTIFSQTLASVFELEAKRIENDLLSIAVFFEGEREKELSKEEGCGEEIEFSEEERKWALDFLSDQKIFDIIADDMTALGYVGETINKLIVYIASMSRFLKRPLNVYIQSGSSGGKSALLNTLEQLILPSDIWKATTISTQALNYVDQQRFLGKVFFMGESIHDEAIEALVRQMQSEGEISRLVTVKDEKTGEMKAQLIRKDVRMSFMVTSTALSLNPENASRCLLICADESKTQTALVLERLGYNHDFEGVICLSEAQKIIKKHHAAQVLFEKVHVYNPFWKHIRFPLYRPSMRRAYEQFLTMIDTICFLRQKQKPDSIRNDPVTGERFRCKACDLTDYTLAYHLFAESVLKNSGFDIPQGTRELYHAIRQMVQESASKEKLKVNQVSFIRQKVREYTQLGGEFIKKHLRILVSYEYIEVVSGRRHGTRNAYRLREDKPIEEMDVSMITTPDELKKLIEADEKF